MNRFIFFIFLFTIASCSLIQLEPNSRQPNSDLFSVENIKEIFQKLDRKLSHKDSLELIDQIDYLLKKHGPTHILKMDKHGFDLFLKQLFQKSKSPETLFQNIYNSKAIAIYDKIQGQGDFQTIYNLNKNRFYKLTKKQKEQAIKVIKNYLKNRFGINTNPKSAITKNKHITKLFSGFPTSDLMAISSQGLRNGSGYGPPGSLQLQRGIYTTKNISSARDWGRVKAFNKNGPDSEHLQSLPFDQSSVMRIDLKEGFNMLDETTNRDIINRMSMIFNNDKNDYYGKQMQKILKDSPEDFSRDPIFAIMEIFDVDIYKATIFQDVGISMGQEYVIKNRSIIKTSKILTKKTSTQEVENFIKNKKNKTEKEINLLIKDENIAKLNKTISDFLITFRGIHEWEFSKFYSRLSETSKVLALKDILENYSHAPYMFYFFGDLLNNKNIQNSEIYELLKWKITLYIRPLIFSTTEDPIERQADAKYSERLLHDITELDINRVIENNFSLKDTMIYKLYATSDKHEHLFAAMDCISNLSSEQQKFIVNNIDHKRIEQLPHYYLKNFLKSLNDYQANYISKVFTTQELSFEKKFEKIISEFLDQFKLNCSQTAARLMN